MYTQASQRTLKKQGWQYRLFDFLIPKLLSGHGKRVLVLASLFFELSPAPVRTDEREDTDIAKLREGAIERMNEVMLLAKSTAALQFPAAFSGIVWRGCNVQDILSAQQFREGLSSENVRVVSERLVDAMPARLRYETRTNMVDDIRKLLSTGQLSGVAA